MNYRNHIVNIDNTRFIFDTNFSGDPNRDRFGSNRRYFNIVIPTKEQADALAAAGVNVKETRPNPDRVYENEFQPTYFVRVIVNMESKWPPRVFWISPNGSKLQCTPENISQLDYIRVKNVCCQAKLYEQKNRPGAYSLYCDILYVEQDVNYDPYYQRYANPEPASDDDLPF